MVMLRGLFAAIVLLVASSTPLWADGAQLFKEKCAKCHGDTGTSDTAVAKKMKIPAIAGNAKIAAMSDADLAKQILATAKHPKGIKSLSADDAAAVAAHVKGLASGK